MTCPSYELKKFEVMGPKQVIETCKGRAQFLDDRFRCHVADCRLRFGRFRVEHGK